MVAGRHGNIQGQVQEKLLQGPACPSAHSMLQQHGTFDAIPQTCLMVWRQDQHMSAPRPSPSHTTPAELRP